MLEIEVAYATPGRQKIIALSVEDGCTAYEAASLSNIIELFPEIDLENSEMGVFSKRLDGKGLPLPRFYQVQMRDRVEIYRALIIDPKAARAERAKKAKEGKVKKG